MEECIKGEILTAFLLREKAKVVSMSIFEFDQELHDKTLREEEYLRGKDDAYEKLSTLINRMMEDGHTDDIYKVTTDKAYRDEMLKHYNI